MHDNEEEALDSECKDEAFIMTDLWQANETAAFPDHRTKFSDCSIRRMRKTTLDKIDAGNALYRDCFVEVVK